MQRSPVIEVLVVVVVLSSCSVVVVVVVVLSSCSSSSIVQLDRRLTPSKNDKKYKVDGGIFPTSLLVSDMEKKVIMMAYT